MFWGFGNIDERVIRIEIGRTGSYVDQSKIISLHETNGRS